MASIRSITTSKPSEHLPNRRVNRSSTSIAASSEKKISNTNNKSSSSIGATTQQKSSRMTSKKDLFEPRTASATIYSTRAIASMDNHEIPSEQMSGLKLHESSPRRRSRSKLSNSASEISANANIEKSLEDQPNSRSICSSVSYKSSTSAPQFTVDSFDTIRTVGTGKTIKSISIVSRSMRHFRNIWSSASCLSSRDEYVLCFEKHVYQTNYRIETSRTCAQREKYLI